MKPLLFKIRSARAPYVERASTSDLFGRGMDLALALLVFVLLGWAIDNWLGTKPLFIIVFALLALVGGGWRIKYAYDEAMDRHERQRAEALRGASARSAASNQATSSQGQVGR
jgi:F0F1-type ATP synthase assembly protein I